MDFFGSLFSPGPHWRHCLRDEHLELEHGAVLSVVLQFELVLSLVVLFTV